MVMMALALVGFAASLVTLWEFSRKVKRAKRIRRRLKH